MGTAAAPAPSPARLVSLDVFRGMTIAGMIIVNNPGDWGHVYGPLLHAEWNGWTPTDLIFPFFLFIVGVSMTFSFAARERRGEPRGRLWPHVLRRGLIIFALGLFLNGFPFFNLAKIRVYGVLQRIGLCYLGAGLIALGFRRRGRALAVAALLVGYWALMMFVPVPGYGAGRLDAEGNLGAYIDRWLLQGHLWKPLWDPEGLLSTFPAIATTLLGVLVGEWLQSERAPRQKLVGLFALGTAGLAAGKLLEPWFPINKNLWTCSYVLFTAGFAAVLLGVCYGLIELRGYRRWAVPFVVLGMNSIAVFFLSTLVAKIGIMWKITQATGQPVSLQRWLYEAVFAPLASPVNASLLFALSYLGVWLAAMWVLYRRRIFIKI
ncbi:MAG: acyltransferase family protein [Candidatus Acidiferrales bacterium]